MKGIASVLASKGRGEDSMLVHMTPHEVGALQGLATLQGGSLTTNPHTGLPEAGILSSALPMIAGALASTFGGPAGGMLYAGLAGGATAGLQGKNMLSGALGGVGGAGMYGMMSGATGALGGAEALAGATPSGYALSDVAALQGPGVSGFPLATEMASGAPQTMASALEQSQAAAALEAANPTTTWDYTKGAYAATPGVDPTTLSATPNTVGASKPTLGGGVRDFLKWNSNDVGSNFWSPDTTGGITGKGGITWLGAGTGLAGATLLGNQANDAMRKAAEERLRRGDPYSPDSMYQQSIAAARQPVPGRGWAVGGPIGSYPNRIPEREVMRDPTAMGTEPSVDPFTGQQQMAGGGVAGQPRFLKGAGDGMSDSIPAHIGGKQPAALANEEFVVPADVVSHLGNGSSEAGAKQLYAMMDRIRKARTGHTKQGKQINAQKLLPA